MARRRHAAANARVLTTGLSASAALGMVTAMALTSAQPSSAPDQIVLSQATPAVPADPTPTAVPGTARQRVVIVKRRYITIPAGAATPPPVAPSTPLPAPTARTAPTTSPPTTSAPAPAPAPQQQPAATTRGS